MGLRIRKAWKGTGEENQIKEWSGKGVFLWPWLGPLPWADFSERVGFLGELARDAALWSLAFQSAGDSGGQRVDLVNCAPV